MQAFYIDIFHVCGSGQICSKDLHGMRWTCSVIPAWLNPGLSHWIASFYPMCLLVSPSRYLSLAFAGGLTCCLCYCRGTWRSTAQPLTPMRARSRPACRSMISSWTGSARLSSSGNRRRTPMTSACPSACSGHAWGTRERYLHLIWLRGAYGILLFLVRVRLRGYRVFPSCSG